MKTDLCVLVLCFVSASARVAVHDEHLDNLIQDKEPVKTDLKHFEAVCRDLQNEVTHEIKIICKIEPEKNITDIEKLEPKNESDKEDNNTALLLTPLIEQGRIAEAKNASRVDPDLFLGYKSYSGFLTVNTTYNSNLFFWYFPVPNKPVVETPWIIWLQGGPGASSITGLFDEIGPFSVHNGTLKPNPYTWLQNHSLVFIDNPVGTGFSFTDHVDGIVTDMATYGKHLHTAVKQLIQLFPELRVAPLYVAGESYAGKYVPALSMEIHKHKDAPGADINLKGLIIGNAFVSPSMISQLIQPFYNFGLLEKEQIDMVKPLIEAFHGDIAANRSIEAKDKWTNLISILLMLSHQKHAYNFLRDEVNAGLFVTFLNQSEIRRALHVGQIEFAFVNLTVNKVLAPDFLSNATPLFETLLDHYRVLAYCGQLDQMLPCAVSADVYRSWKWNASKEFSDAIRVPFLLNRRVVGYRKSGGGLTWVVIRGAGHMVPMDAPAAAQAMITLWTRSYALPRPMIVLTHNLIEQFVANSTSNNSTSSVYL